jgi:erythromycin esterase
MLSDGPTSSPTSSACDDWIAAEAISFSLDEPRRFDAAVDEVMVSLASNVELLGFGEALHGGEELLLLRNRLFQRLVEAHGYSAIAIESSFPRARVINEYVSGDGPAKYEAARDVGFSHGFGRLDANQELVEWMRQYNADPSHAIKLQFYGFDSPTEMGATDSPRQLLEFALDYVESTGLDHGREQRRRIELLLGQDSEWENPAALMVPAQSIGLSSNATALRIETEEFLTTLGVLRPELVARSDEPSYSEAAHYAAQARQLLPYHAGLARASDDRLVRLLGLRDAMMADNLIYIVSREHGRGKVFAFAHNSHLQRGSARWQLGDELLDWWPAGSQLDVVLGPRYAVIGSAVGVSDDNGIGKPEPGTLEARLTDVPGPACFIPMRSGRGLPTSTLAALPVRSASLRNQGYFPLTHQSLTDFDYVAFVDATTYSRGGPQLPP